MKPELIGSLYPLEIIHSNSKDIIEVSVKGISCHREQVHFLLTLIKNHEHLYTVEHSLPKKEFSKAMKSFIEQFVADRIGQGEICRINEQKKQYQVFKENHGDSIVIKDINYNGLLRNLSVREKPIREIETRQKQWEKIQMMLHQDFLEPEVPIQKKLV